MAVGQIFRALSEFDKGGRATRRALKFSQLVAETGVDDATVRQVLDRFRANDCSFLTPPPFEVKAISGDTRIDVGHEALLRRWDKVSGRGAELGWLRTEQQAGERYRGLLAICEGNNPGLRISSMNAGHGGCSAAHTCPGRPLRRRLFASESLPC